jgi:hypothetical protein
MSSLAPFQSMTLTASQYGFCMRSTFGFINNRILHSITSNTRAAVYIGGHLKPAGLCDKQLILLQWPRRPAYWIFSR